MNLNPLHGNGVYVRPPATCEQPWLQWGHQSNDRVGREELAQAIAQAEADLETELHYRLLPAWETDEWRVVDRPWKPENFNYSVTDVRGLGLTVKTEWGYLVSGGIRSKELVKAAAAVSYSDPDGDGYKELATITETVDFTNPCELALYFRQAGVVEESADDMWQIRPLRASISGTTAIIRARREQFVTPELQTKIVPPADDSHLRGVKGDDDGNFATSVDIYRVYNDPQLQAQFLWEPAGCGVCGGTGCATCSYATQYGCFTARGDLRHGTTVLTPATWNAATKSFDAAGWAVGRAPDLVRLWYYAGWRAKGGTCPALYMDPVYERAVAYYAAALLERNVCGCENVAAFVGRWQEDLAKTPAEKGARAISAAALECPFGSSRGAVFAWNRLDNAIGSGALP